MEPSSRGNLRGHGMPSTCRGLAVRNKRRARRAIAHSTSAGGHGHASAPSVGIFGAGAAGLTAAYFAATSGRSSRTSDVVVTLYEKTGAPGAKIKASGGSRCNILPNPDEPLNIDADFQMPPSTKKGALRALLSSWNPHECRGWLEYDIGIPLKLEESTNKLFPRSDRGAEVRDKLASACAREHVRMEMNAQLTGIDIVDDSFRCRFADGRERVHSHVVLATGGKSFPALGTTGEGYDILKDLGVQINLPEPALTPLLFARKDNALVSLAGVSLQNAVMSVTYVGRQDSKNKELTGNSTGNNSGKRKPKPTVRTAVRGQSLITHRGMSGPDAMDLSDVSNLRLESSGYAYRMCWNRDFRTTNDCEAFFGDALRTTPKKTIRSILSAILPTSLASFLLDAANIDQQTNVSSLKKSDKLKLIQLMTAYELDIDRNEGFAKAEVSAGGIPLEDLDIATMQVRKVPGLHVIGELVDVHGRIGGFNFLLAWYQGRLAGHAVGKVFQRR